MANVDKLIKLYQKEFGKSLILTESDMDNCTNSIDSENVLSLYSKRYADYRNQKGKRDPNYELLLEKIKNYDGSKIIIHGINNRNGTTLFFTDELILILIGTLHSALSKKTSY